MAKHTLRVVRDPLGWTICLGAGMSSPFRTRAGAIREAECLREQLCGHGEAVEIVIEDGAGTGLSPADDSFAADRLGRVLRDLRSRGKDAK